MKVKNNDEEFTFLCIYSKNTKILIVGGGNSALIKAKSFLGKGFNVECVSPNFNEEFLQIKNERLKLIKEEFKDELIFQYHLVVICTNKEEVNSHIRDICDRNYKVYIDTTLPENSIATLCATTSTKQVSIGLRTTNKSPKTAQFLVKKVRNYLINYDDYVYFATSIRNRINNFPQKNQLLNFISSEDFLFFFKKSYGEAVLKLFYGGENFES